MGAYMLRRLAWIILPLWLFGATGCALCVGGAIGAGAGYIAHKEGYRVPLPKSSTKTQRSSASPWAAPDQR
jgi:hypothetical protein